MIEKFSNNVPGKGWVKSFLTCYLRTKENFASNIKHSRAEVAEETLRAYIENLKEIVKDVPKESIWNFDKTYLTDDPGKRKIICCCDIKCPLKHFLMMCGSAAGEMLPPFVVYKATCALNVEYMDRGMSKKCRYQRTKSG